jgi:hypothetical protein
MFISRVPLNKSSDLSCGFPLDTGTFVYAGRAPGMERDKRFLRLFVEGVMAIIHLLVSDQLRCFSPKSALSRKDFYKLSF